MFKTFVSLLSGHTSYYMKWLPGQTDTWDLCNPVIYSG